MPIYEFSCAKCGHRFEMMQRMSEEAIPPCPECRSKRTKKLMSASGFLLKGSGWYKTEYPSEARRKGLADEKGGAAAPAPTEGKPSESATAPTEPAGRDGKPASKEPSPKENASPETAAKGSVSKETASGETSSKGARKGPKR
jgi:putative FmdB family regulatory protein